MQTYLDLLRHVRDTGTRKEDRTGVARSAYLVIKCALIF